MINNTTESFIYQYEHNVSISKYVSNSTTGFMPQHEVYINTLANVNDVSSLLEFYRLMFAGNPLVLLTCVFVGAYIGCMFIEKYRRKPGGEKK